MTADEIRVKLSRACERAGSQRQWALHHGISPAYVCDVLLGRRNPGPAILNALGFTMAQIYRRRNSGAKREKLV